MFSHYFLDNVFSKHTYVFHFHNIPLFYNRDICTFPSFSLHFFAILMLARFLNCHECHFQLSKSINCVKSIAQLNLFFARLVGKYVAMRFFVLSPWPFSLIIIWYLRRRLAGRPGTPGHKPIVWAWAQQHLPRSLDIGHRSFISSN